MAPPAKKETEKRGYKRRFAAVDGRIPVDLLTKAQLQALQDEIKAEYHQNAEAEVSEQSI